MSNVSLLMRAMRHLLGRQLSSIGDFYCLATTGEQLRRAIAMEGMPDQGQLSALAEYTNALSAFCLPALPQVDRDMASLLDSLREYASTANRDRQSGMRMLDAIDEQLSVAKALHLKGRITAKTLQTCGFAAWLAVNALSAELPELWSYAHGQDCALAPDPDFPDLYAFWEELALFSEEQSLMREAAGVMPTVDRQASIERIISEVTS